MIALDLFCCAGGAGEGIRRAGFDVTGVDITHQPNYRAGKFIRADAVDVLEDLLGGGELVARPDFVWASPPCQRFSAATRQTGKPREWPDLIVPIRERLIRLGVPYVIENVIGAPLINPITLCGEMFGLRVIRHRLFECSWNIERPAHPPHRGSLVTGEYVTVAGGGGVPSWTYKEREKRGMPRYPWGAEEYSLASWRKAMGIDWMSREELVEAIPPAFSEWIGRRAMAEIDDFGGRDLI